MFENKAWKCGTVGTVKKLAHLQPLSSSNSFTQPTYKPITFANMQLWTECQHNWKTEVALTTASVRRFRNSGSSSQVPHTCKLTLPTTNVTASVSFCLVRHTHLAIRPASVSFCFPGFFIYIYTLCIYILFVCVDIYIYKQNNTHPHTMLLSQPPSFPSPTTCSP